MKTRPGELVGKHRVLMTDWANFCEINARTHRTVIRVTHCNPSGFIDDSGADNDIWAVMPHSTLSITVCEQYLHNAATK
jgi:hypothetical protein